MRQAGAVDADRISRSSRRTISDVPLPPTYAMAVPSGEIARSRSLPETVIASAAAGTGERRSKGAEAGDAGAWRRPAVQAASATARRYRDGRGRAETSRQTPRRRGASGGAARSALRWRLRGLGHFQRCIANRSQPLLEGLGEGAAEEASDRIRCGRGRSRPSPGPW